MTKTVKQEYLVCSNCGDQVIYGMSVKNKILCIGCVTCSKCGKHPPNILFTYQNLPICPQCTRMGK